MLADEQKRGRLTLLNPVKRSSLLRPIRSGREFCVFVKADHAASSAGVAA